MADNVFPQLHHFLHELFPESKVSTDFKIPYRVGSQVPKFDEQQAMDRLKEKPSKASVEYLWERHACIAVKDDRYNGEVEYIG